MKLSEENCRPVRAEDIPLPAKDAKDLAREIPLWTFSDKEIKRDLKFKDFRQAIAFVNKLADIAEAQDHHPDILISYNKINLTLSTHRINGLSRNDFILAAKIDMLVQPV